MARQRMTGEQRREQLIEIGRAVFAHRGFDGASVEEIASRAGVSKPVVYEHFGGKEGLYNVVVEREMNYLERVIRESLVQGRSKERIEKAVVALLTYVERDTEGFAILVRDAGGARSQISDAAVSGQPVHSAVSGQVATFASTCPNTPEAAPNTTKAASSSPCEALASTAPHQPTAVPRSYLTLLNLAVNQVSHILGDKFDRQGLDRSTAVIYGQAMVGMVSMTAQWWLDNREVPKETIAAHIVNLCWNGLEGLEAAPRLSPSAAELRTQLEKEGI